MTAVTASPRLKRIQRTSVALLVLGCALNYVDRSTLAIANPLIRKDLGLSIADMGLLLSAFLWAYAAFQLPAGALVDRLGPRKLLGAGIFIWSLAQALGGLVGGFWQFVGARVFLGMGESPQFSGLVRVVRDWFNVRERGLPTGIGLCGSKLGPAIAPPLLTVLMLAFGWRWMFVIMGGVGIGVAILWYAVYREPREVALTEDEKAYLTDGEAQQVADRVTWADWKQLFAYRATWGMVLGFFGEVYMGWVYQAWLPGYLEIERHMSIGKTGWVAAIPFACGVLGSVGAGWLTDHLSARGVSPINSCKIPVVIGLDRDGGLHHRHGADPEHADRGHRDVHRSGVQRHGRRDVLGTGQRRGAAALHGVARLDPELRRLYRWRAGSDDHRIHRAGHRKFRSGPAVQRRRWG